MIFGIGTDISKVSRFEKWVKNEKIINRFFNSNEIVEFDEKKLNCLCEYYAVRFAAKEAFSKALGTGFVGLELSDFGIVKDEQGKPYFIFGKKTKSVLEKIVGLEYKVHVSLSHEKEYATAFVVIEK